MAETAPAGGAVCAVRLGHPTEGHALVSVGEKTANALMAKLEPKVRALKIGPGTDADAEMRPLVTKEHLAKVRGYIDAGVAEGARLVVDGRDFRRQGYENGYFIGGTLFDGVTTDMRIHQEEIFGPVLVVTLASKADASFTVC